MDMVYKQIVDTFRPLQNLLAVPFMVGGGCISDLIAFGYVNKDFDFFFKNYEDMVGFENRIKELGFRLVGESDMVRQYKFLNVQFEVITWQTKPTALDFVSSFDFTCNGIMLDGNILTLHEHTIQDCVNKELHPIRTLDLQYQYRIKRYMDKGYNVLPNTELHRILFNHKFTEPIYASYGGFIEVDLANY
jgi:hypothetical protein